MWEFQSENVDFYEAICCSRHYTVDYSEKNYQEEFFEKNNSITGTKFCELTYSLLQPHFTFLFLTHGTVCRNHSEILRALKFLAKPEVWCVPWALKICLNLCFCRSLPPQWRQDATDPSPAANQRRPVRYLPDVICSRDAHRGTRGYCVSKHLPGTTCYLPM